MDILLEAFFDSLDFGDDQHHQNMIVIPLISDLDGGPAYITMKEALEKAVFSVTEVNEMGQVPELKVWNRAEIPILLLDGEELAGAKQNRVLSTTILVKEGAQLIIPVACTERDRWSYASREFRDSGNVMSPGMRATNRRAVSSSLESSRKFQSDQSEIWYHVDCCSHRTMINSRTSAMSDVFEAKKSELDSFLEAFTCRPGQKGLVVMINGEAAGMEYISSAEAFAVLFPKLIKSYALETWLKTRGRHARAGDEDSYDGRKLDSFWRNILDCEHKSYDSVGMGRDVRLAGRSIVGSALVVDDTPVHLAFFNTFEDDRVGSMASLDRRRSFRSRS